MALRQWLINQAKKIITPAPSSTSRQDKHHNRPSQYRHNNVDFWRPVLSPSAPKSSWSLTDKLCYLGPQTHQTLERLLQHMIILGKSGAGKSSAILYNYARMLFEYGVGAYITTVKVDDIDLWKRIIKDAGREEDLIIIGEDSDKTFNFLTYQASIAGGKEINNIVGLFMDIVKANNSKDTASNNEQFWESETRKMLNATFALLTMADQPFSLHNMRSIILDAPQCEDQKSNQQWQAQSEFFRIFGLALLNFEDSTQAHKNQESTSFSPSQLRDFQIASDYWLKEYPNKNERTRGDLISSVTGLFSAFDYGIIRELLMSDKPNSFSPWDMFKSGKIVLANFPTDKYGSDGKVAQSILSIVGMGAVLQRKVSEHPRPVFFFHDEVQRVFTPEVLANNMERLRSQRGGVIVATQSKENALKEMPGRRGEAIFSSLFGGVSTSIFAWNLSTTTNEWASKTFYREWKTRSSTSAQMQSRPDGTITPNSSVSHSSELQQNVLPIQFTELADGGPENNLVVEAIVNNAGKLYQESGYIARVIRFVQMYGFEENHEHQS